MGGGGGGYWKGKEDVGGGGGGGWEGIGLLGDCWLFSLGLSDLVVVGRDGNSDCVTLGGGGMTDLVKRGLQTSLVLRSPTTLVLRSPTRLAGLTLFDGVGNSGGRFGGRRFWIKHFFPLKLGWVTLEYKAFLGAPEKVVKVSWCLTYLIARTLQAFRS